jgi:hypothetical protein
MRPLKLAGSCCHNPQKPKAGKPVPKLLNYCLSLNTDAVAHFYTTARL